MGEMIELKSGDGAAIGAWLAAPAAAPRAAVVVVQEILESIITSVRSPTGSPRPAISRSRRRCSTASRRASNSATTPPEMARGMEIVAKVDREAALSDIAAAVQRVASAGKVGVVGFCWGGTMAWLAAARTPGICRRGRLLRRRNHRPEGLAAAGPDDAAFRRA